MTSRPGRRAAPAVTGPIATTIGGAGTRAPRPSRVAAEPLANTTASTAASSASSAGRSARARPSGRRRPTSTWWPAASARRRAPDRPGRPGRSAPAPGPAGTRPAALRPAARRHEVDGAAGGGGEHPRRRRADRGEAHAGWLGRAAARRAPAPLADVTTSQSNAARRASARRRATPPSAGSAISMSGTWTTWRRARRAGPELARLGSGDRDPPPGQRRPPSAVAQPTASFAVRAASRRARGHRRRQPTRSVAGDDQVDVPAVRSVDARNVVEPAARRHARRRGSEHPAPSSARNARSTVDGVAGRRVIDGRQQLDGLLVVRVRASTATQPCPTAGTNRAGSRRSATRSVSPSTSSAATAITIDPSSGTLPRRVAMLPRSSVNRRSGAHDRQLGPPPHRSGGHGGARPRARPGTAR